MAKTLLNSVNEILKRTSFIAGDAGTLTSLTDSARQVAIDQAVQVINEGIQELYAVPGMPPMPLSQAENTVTLATGTRAYALNSGVVTLRWPLIDKTNSQFIKPFPGGYAAMLVADPEQDDTGLPYFAAIRPTDGYLHMDRAPTSAENGRIYTYQYYKNTLMSLAADTVPFDDPVWNAMVPAWVQLWKREMRNEFDGELYRIGMGRAARLMTKVPARQSYGSR